MGSDETDHLAGTITHCDTPGIDPAVGAVLVLQAVLDLVARAFSGEVGMDRRLYLLTVFGMHSLLPSLQTIFKLIRGEAEHVLPSRGERHFIGVEIPVPQALVRCLQDEFESFSLVAPMLLVNGQTNGGILRGTAGAVVLSHLLWLVIRGAGVTTETIHLVGAGHVTLIRRNQTDSHGMQNCLGAALHTQFGKNIADVRLDSFFANGEVARDLLVGLPLGQKLQHVLLAFGEGFGPLWRANLAHETGGSFRRELNLAGRRCLDRSPQLIRVRVLEQVTGGSRSHRVYDRAVFHHARQGDDLNVGRLVPKRANCGDAVHHRHEEIHQHHIRMELFGQLDRFGSVRRLADDLNLRIELEKHPQSLANHRMIVCDDDTDHHQCFTFRRSSSTVQEPTSMSGSCLMFCRFPIDTIISEQNWGQGQQHKVSDSSDRCRIGQGVPGVSGFLRW